MSKNEKTILHLTKFGPPLLIISFSIIIFIVLHFNNKKIFNEAKLAIEQEYIEKNKERIKEVVERIHDQIILQQKKTEKALKENLKLRVYEAHKIALNIYKQNKNLKKEIIVKIIKDALRNIRFNNGRGYFFIYSFDYKGILHPTSTNQEDEYVYNYKNKELSQLVTFTINKVKKEGEAFFIWNYYKPNTITDKQYKKIGFIKHFKPYNWIIGTGEYIDDFENDIKKETLKHINKLKFKNNGYIFVLDYKGNYLQHIRKELIGHNIFEEKYTQTNNILPEALNLIKTKGEGYISYIHEYKPDTGLPSKKISYIKNIDKWGWLIGKGFYEEDFQKLIEKEKTILNKRLKNNLNNLFTITFILTIILLFISFYISKFFEKRFQIYKEDITKHEHLLSQQSKLASMGMMIGNIAHQWRQPLSLISTAATGLSLKKELGVLEDQELLDNLNSINNSTQYLSKTIDDFRNFFLTNKDKKEFCLEDTIEKTLNLVQTQFINKNIKIIKKIKKVQIYGIQTELIQVLINILNNARDELIKLENQERLIFIKTKVEDNFIIISIKDNAGGIENEILEYIFEPYFTTKHQSQGTGIGLYMSREIIIKHFDASIQLKNTNFVYNKNNYKGVEVSLKFNIHK